MTSNVPQFRVILPEYVSEGQPFGVGFQRLDTSAEGLAQEIPVTMVLNPSAYGNYVTDADIGTTQRVFNTTIPAYQVSTYIQFQAQNDGLVEGPETFRFYAYSPGSEQFTEYHQFGITDANKPEQNIVVTLLDKELTFSEGESTTLHVAISGNIAGTEENIYVPTTNYLGEGGVAGSQLKFSTPSQYASERWTMTKLAPGQTYAELTITSLEDTLRENDQTDTIGSGIKYDIYEQNGYKTTVSWKGSTKITLLDDDWAPAPAPAQSPTVVINGSNNIINQNTYNDNRVYVNSFNQTYVNSFNGTAGRDSLTGTTQNDQLAGLNGNDVLRGAQGNDSVIGGAGKDQLFGGLGLNTLDGGAGRDVYNVAAETNAAQADILKNFTGTDRINIIGATNLTFQSMQDGIGIFNNGVLQSLVTGNVGLDAVRNATSAI